MKNQLCKLFLYGILPLVLSIIFTSCPEFEKINTVTSVIIIDQNGYQNNLVIIAEGQSVTLKAEVMGADIDDVSIVWEIPPNDAVVIISSGKGAECTIKGLKTGDTNITVKAWRSPEDVYKSKSIFIHVGQAPQPTGINNISGPSKITVGEVQIIKTEFIPAWADGDIIWEHTPENIIELTPTSNILNCTVKGLIPGVVTITAKTGSYSKDFSLQVTPSALGNPVTGIRINYSNADIGGRKLPVSNIIWLYPDDEVELEAQTTGGAASAITWEINNANEVKLNGGIIHTGQTCTLTGGSVSNFNAPPAVVQITALNGDNTEPVTAFVLIKTQEKPVWAWDRARDGHLNLNITPPQPTSILPADTPQHTISSYEAATFYTMKGRGIYSEKFSNGLPIKAKGNFIPYTIFGIQLNSSNNFSGTNPDPVRFPEFGSTTSATYYNSTRIMIGSNIHADTDTNVQQNGIFDFLEETRNIRISVDYEILWTAGASRDMWIMVNNNNANAAQSMLGTNSQLLVEPLIAARGTRATAVTTLDIRDYTNQKVKGWETLDKSFIGIVALSNGGNIYVSGIRIEYED